MMRYVAMDVETTLQSARLSLGIDGALRRLKCATGYAVSSCGKVVSLQPHHRSGRITPRVMKLLTGARYKTPSADLKVGGKSLRRSVAELVAEAFLPARPSDSAFVWHVNLDRTDNRAANLIWRVLEDPPPLCAECHRPGQDYYHRSSVCKQCDHARKSSWRKANLLRARQIGRECATRRHQEHRDMVLAEYGGKCACCGIDQPEFLNIDHVRGGGNAHRRSLGYSGRMASTAVFYRWLKKQGFPKGEFQLLCCNCNFAKSRYGVCPHQRGKK